MWGGMSLTTGDTAQLTVMAVGPHPDDVESAIGGTLGLASKAGHRGIVLCPVVAPELPSDCADDGLGEDHPRLEEARQGAAVLGCHLQVVPLRPYMSDAAACGVLVNVIRTHRPQIMLVNHADDAHPFHVQVGRWALEACYLAQLGTVRTVDPPWTVAQIYSYKAFSARTFVPNIYIDVTSTFALARRALICHRSGLAMLPGLMHWSEAVHVNYGLHIARPYAEGIRRIGGAHWDHIENSLVGLQFVMRLHHQAQEFVAGGSGTRP